MFAVEGEVVEGENEFISLRMVEVGGYGSLRSMSMKY